MWGFPQNPANYTPRVLSTVIPPLPWGAPASIFYSWRPALGAMHAKKTAVQGRISIPSEAVARKPLCLHLSPTPRHLYTGDCPPLSPTWAASAGCLGNRLRRPERRCRGRKELLLHPLLKCVPNLISNGTPRSQPSRRSAGGAIGLKRWRFVEVHVQQWRLSLGQRNCIVVTKSHTERREAI